MLLDFIIFEHRIEANPKKIVAITKMDMIQYLKGMRHPSKTRWTSSMKHAMSPCSDQPSTGKHCDDITATECWVGRSMSVT
jgi:hypothetical protein